jgi:hypothetical protein
MYILEIFDDPELPEKGVAIHGDSAAMRQSD